VTNVALWDELNAVLEDLEEAAAPARAARDRYIAQLECEVVRRSESSRPGHARTSRRPKHSQAIDELLPFVDNHFTRSSGFDGNAST
jgi:hypothetical protein